MAYDGYGIPRLDFSPLARIPQQMRERQLQENRQATLADLAQGVPLADVSRKLFAAGDIEGGMSLARLADAQAQRDHQRSVDDRNFSFREAEAKRAQQNWETERTDPRYVGTPETGIYTLPRGAAGASGMPPAPTQVLAPQQDKPQLKTLKDASGNESLVYVRPDGRVTKLDTGEREGPANPFASDGKMTESQAKDALYARRMLASEKVLRDVESVGTSAMERARGAVSDRIGYNIRGSEFQKFDQAQRDFINATLRRESGAVISPQEFDNANKQYFPQPGDTPEVIRQKRANRREAIQGIGAGAGPSWRPDYTFGPNGELNRNTPRAEPATAPANPRVRGAFDAALGRPDAQAAPVQYDGPEISQAREAIARGADPQKVKELLKKKRIPFAPQDLELN